MRVIKRYANRRLYDSNTSRTITLEEVAVFVRSGEEIQVIDNITQEDITSKVLGQTFLKVHDPGKNEPLINFIFTALIRESDGGFVNMMKKMVFAGIGMTQMPSEEREMVMQALVKLEHASDEHKEIFASLAKKGRRQADQIWQSVINTVDDVAKKIQKSLLTTIEPFERSKRIEGLSKQIDDLARKIRQISSKSPSNKE